MSELRKCIRCGAEHARNHKWCAPCHRECKRRHEGSRRYTKQLKGDVSVAPPPPPGFDPRDLQTGRPVL